MMVVLDFACSHAGRGRSEWLVSYMVYMTDDHCTEEAAAHPIDRTGCSFDK